MVETVTRSGESTLTEPAFATVTPSDARNQLAVPLRRPQCGVNGSPWLPTEIYAVCAAVVVLLACRLAVRNQRSEGAVVVLSGLYLEVCSVACQW